MTGGVLLVRCDSDGDVLLTGPAVRAVARHERVTMLVSPSGAGAAGLLPGIADLLRWPCPWTGYQPPPVDPAGIQRLVDTLRAGEFRAAVVFTSDHQSPLPMALLLRLAGVPSIAAMSRDYPGSLLDVRHRPPPGHESQRMVSLATAAGYPPAAEDDGRLAIRRPLPPVPEVVPDGPFVVVHPGASVPARAATACHTAAMCRALAAAGWDVVVTGGPDETALTRTVAAGHATDLGGRTDLATLAAVLDRASCLVVGNTGPAHLAAAVGTPVVSLFAPVVPVERWAPFGVPHVVLGDQHAPCRDTRARQCPVPGHPCLTSIHPDAVVEAVSMLAGDRLERVEVVR